MSAAHNINHTAIDLYNLEYHVAPKYSIASSLTYCVCTLQEENLLRLVLQDQEPARMNHDRSLSGYDTEPASRDHVATGGAQEAPVVSTKSQEVSDLKQRLQLHERLAEQQQSQPDSQKAEANKLHDELQIQQKLVRDLQRELANSHDQNVSPQMGHLQQQPSQQYTDTAAVQARQTSLLEQHKLVATLQLQLSSSDDRNKQLQQQLEALHEEKEESRQRCELQELLVQQIQGELQAATNQCHQLQDQDRLQQRELMVSQQENDPEVRI